MLYQQLNNEALNRTVKKNSYIDASRVVKHHNKFGKQQLSHKNVKKSKEYLLSPQEVKILLCDINTNNSTANYNNEYNFKNGTSNTLYSKHSYTHSSPNLLGNIESDSLKKQLQNSIVKQELLMKKKLFDPHAYFGNSQTSQEMSIDQSARLQKKKLDSMLSKSQKDLRKNNIEAEIFSIKKLGYLAQNITKKQEGQKKKQLKQIFNNTTKTPIISPIKDGILQKDSHQSSYNKSVQLNKVAYGQMEQNEIYPSFYSILSKVKSFKENLCIQEINKQDLPYHDEKHKIIDLTSNPFAHLLQKQYDKFTNDSKQLQSINSNNLDSLKNSSCCSRSPSYLSNNSDNTIKQKRPHQSPKSVVRQSRQTFKIKLNQINQMKRMRIKLKLNGTSSKTNA